MNDVTVSKEALIEKLHLNKVEHQDKVAKARAKYREMVIAELDKRLAQAKTGRDIDPGFLNRLPIPRDYSAEYDKVIEALSWELADEIELPWQDFCRYIRNEWEWQGAFTASTQTYLAQ